MFRIHKNVHQQNTDELQLTTANDNQLYLKSWRENLSKTKCDKWFYNINVAFVKCDMTNLTKLMW